MLRVGEVEDACDSGSSDCSSTNALGDANGSASTRA